MKRIDKLNIFALASHGEGISGGDRIFIELARRWQKKFAVEIFLWEEGLRMCQRQKLQKINIKYRLSNLGFWKRFGFVVNYIARILEGVNLGLTLKLEKNPGIFLYNASEFWMDSFPCVILKIRYPKAIWIATWFQTAPNPLKGYAEEERGAKYKRKAFLYWLIQLPVKPLIKKYADKVIVNNEDERKRFPKLDNKGDVIVLIGAVRLDEIKKFLSDNHKASFIKKYDAVFQGRFHPQKGVIELIDIWKRVVERLPKAKLAMIGDGPLYKDVEDRIGKLGMKNNIKLFGYVFDGAKKYEIFAQSKIVVHPAFYDSGGMATAEAMAFGLPAIGFSLRAYESYYPKGMVKVKDEKEFANKIIKILKNKCEQKEIGEQARNLIYKNYSWDHRAERVFMEMSN